MLELFPEIEQQGIDFVDIGCSGALDKKYSDLFPLLSYTGFDPNEGECDRLSGQAHPYRSARYFPYAIAGEKGLKTLYLTENNHCHSLLRPNHQWLDRFSYADLFREKGTESVRCTTLNALVDNEYLKADIIKIDTQGLELPILRSGAKLLGTAFCVETETGFVENYINETTYAQIDEFMRSKGFLMFDMNIHRVGRNNPLSAKGRHQPLWCEATWLYDFVGQKREPSREQALKSLTVCKALQYIDYGFELSGYYKSLGIIDREAFSYLEKPENWLIKRKPLSRTGRLLSVFPKTVKEHLLHGLKEILE